MIDDNGKMCRVILLFVAHSSFLSHSIGPSDSVNSGESERQGIVFFCISDISCDVMNYSYFYQSHGTYLSFTDSP